MKLTESNYFSEEADREYLSCSQFKNFVGTLGKKPCEAHAIAILNGEWKDETTIALLVGSYVDAHFEGTLDLFKAQHPEMFKKDGSPKAEYVKADIMINRCERDEKFMQYMDGYKQVIMTADMFGSKWKIKIDSYHPGTAIVDLKTCESVTKQFYSKDLGYMNFIEYWGYLYQGAIYREVEYLNHNPMLKLRGHLIPLMFNYNLLSDDVDKKDSYSILIVETQGIKFGFVVDKFVNQLDIVQKPLASNFRNHPFISGTSLLGNGEVLFVINPSKLIKLKEKK